MTKAEMVREAQGYSHQFSVHFGSYAIDVYDDNSALLGRETLVLSDEEISLLNKLRAMIDKVKAKL